MLSGGLQLDEVAVQHRYVDVGQRGEQSLVAYRDIGAVQIFPALDDRRDLEFGPIVPVTIRLPPLRT